jgi:hypothetical protein
MTTVEKNWAVAQNLGGLAILVALVWLRSDFVFVIGGGAALLLGIGQLSFLRQDPTARGLLLKILLLMYLVLGLNFIAGLERVSGTPEWVRVVFIQLLVFGAVLVCISIVSGFLPPHTRPSELPSWAQRLWARLMVPVAGSLFFITLAWGIRAGVRADEDTGLLGTFASSVLLLLCSIVGYLSLIGIQRHDAPPLISRVTRKLLLFSPVWLIVGTAGEIPRGAWGVWLPTAATILAVLIWVHALASRTPAGEVSVRKEVRT